MNEKIKYWLELAEYDLETAQAMLVSRRFLYVGFMCHQVVEKSLKAYFIFQREGQPPFTHNLSFLAEKSGLYDEMSEAQKDFMDILMPLNIEARYPTYKENILKFLNFDRCETILKQTRELFEWIKQRLLKA